MWNVLRYLFRKVLGRMPGLLTVGSPAPDFAVADHTGVDVTRAGLLGTRYVLWFYPKADTPG